VLSTHSWFALANACSAIAQRRSDSAFTILREAGLVPRDLALHGPHMPVQLLEHAVCALRAMAGPQVLHFAHDGSRFQIDSWNVDLTSRPTLRRVLAALIHAESPLSAAALIAAGWPDELMSRDAGQSRVRTTIASLRRIGLADVIVHRAGGYFLNHRVEVRVVPSSMLTIETL
jgi:hypothetical protein